MSDASKCNSSDKNRVSKVVVIGGGPVGALNACLFAKRGWNVDVYEYRQDVRKCPPDCYNGRSISLSVSERARAALRAVGLEQKALELCEPQYGRFCHGITPEKHFYMTYSPAGDKCILSTSRRMLNEMLLSEAEKLNVRLFFQHKLRYYKSETNELVFEREEIIDTFTKFKPNSLISVKCKPYHFGKNIVLLGDAAHAMVPFYGQGMNCVGRYS